ncbi:MAG: glutamate synthase-related protein, partial [Fimbriimonadales bacterium]
ELKTVNPRAKVVVKVPVVANIGVIAVGIAKAGADVITLSGYDGGTGAARAHAIHRAGLPVEIGLHLAHHALTQAGLRESVELWADGGIRSAIDVVRMVLLGANRVGFGTLAMVAIGCTICRGCQTDTCHVGIATQMTTLEQAQARGLKRFEPQQFDLAVARLVQFFRAMGEAVCHQVAQLGYDRLQSLVGRADLLCQMAHQEQIDLSPLFVSAPLPEPRGESSSRRIARLRSYTTQWITQAILSEVDRSPEGLVYEDTELEAMDQAIGAHLAGTLTRARIGLPTPKGYSEWMPEGLKSVSRVDLCLSQTLAGHGLGAFNVPPLAIRVEGGAQDGVAKSACGGMVAVLKGTNLQGMRVDGSVGKSFAYGAQRGFFIVQGYADSRACVRLSGAEVVFGARLQHPVERDPLQCLERAHLKGFAFEYMTGGRVVVLGDPGPYLCAGMTGGVVYVKLWHEWGLTEQALRCRLARGAKVQILPTQTDDHNDLRRLLLLYAHELDTSQQHEEARAIRQIVANDLHQFVKIVPIRQQEDQTVSTE